MDSSQKWSSNFIENSQSFRQFYKNFRVRRKSASQAPYIFIILYSNSLKNFLRARFYLDSVENFKAPHLEKAEVVWNCGPGLIV